MLASGLFAGCSANSAPSKPSTPSVTVEKTEPARKQTRMATFAEEQKRFDDECKRVHCAERFAERQKRYQAEYDEAEREAAAAKKNP